MGFVFNRHKKLALEVGGQVLNMTVRQPRPDQLLRGLGDMLKIIGEGGDTLNIGRALMVDPSVLEGMLTFLSTTVLSWDAEEDGQPMECTPENVKEVLGSDMYAMGRMVNLLMGTPTDESEKNATASSESAVH